MSGSVTSHQTTRSCTRRGSGCGGGWWSTSSPCPGTSRSRSTPPDLYDTVDCWHNVYNCLPPPKVHKDYTVYIQSTVYSIHTFHVSCSYRRDRGSGSLTPVHIQEYFHYIAFSFSLETLPVLSWGNFFLLKFKMEYKNMPFVDTLEIFNYDMKLKSCCDFSRFYIEYSS